jgi:hypothetical protein
MVIILREAIRFEDVEIIRNCARLWKCCLKFFYGFAEVFCGAVLWVIEIGCTDVFRSPGASRLPCDS